MLGVRGADKLVIRGIHQIPNPLDLPGYVVHMLLGRDAGSLSLFLDLLTMLIGAGLEIHVKACHTLIAGNGVSQDDFIGIANMGLGRGIGNGGGYIVGFFLHGKSSLPEV